MNDLSKAFSKGTTGPSLDPEKVFQAILEAGQEWADNEAAASLLEETKKTVLARLMLSHQAAAIAATGKGIAQQEAEKRALDDPRYEAHIELMVAARKKAHTSRVRYDTAKLMVDLQRSIMATQRAELNLR